MRAICGALSIIMALIIALPSMASADIDKPGGPQYANNIFSDFSTPTVAPGDTFVFSFNLTNPYDDVMAVMTNVNLTVGIYRYATQEEVTDVNQDFESPPCFENGDVETSVIIDELDIGETERIELGIAVGKSTPHGSYFSQATYFIRLKLSFLFEGNSTPVILQSRGYFSQEEWDDLVSFDPGESIIDMTYMESLGIDGLIPDSSFGVKIPIPKWPLGVLIGASCALGFGALYYFVLDNPGKYPSLEKRFYKLRGKMRELWGKLKHIRRK
ncbi:MAG: hypothetical protein IH630_01305 [Thermoplasmata archaeon]|nr:hypothetical protein [Thermoplasmata archaeon]